MNDRLAGMHGTGGDGVRLSARSCGGKVIDLNIAKFYSNLTSLLLGVGIVASTGVKA